MKALVQFLNEGKSRQQNNIATTGYLKFITAEMRKTIDTEVLFILRVKIKIHVLTISV
jgi:hypothetical protein